MRGKLCNALEHEIDRRITPAHAGKTLPVAIYKTRLSDHPRTCGENYRLGGAYLSRSGSPPHMRGKLLRCRCLCRASRITPAHAGKTFSEFQKRKGLSDHPRTCGENFSPDLSNLLYRGSPPHMRGKLITLPHPL